MDEKTAREKAEALPSLLLPWYDKNKRDLPWRENTDPYRVWVSEIMLQQTRVEAAIPYYERFLESFPTLQALQLAVRRFLQFLGPPFQAWFAAAEKESVYHIEHDHAQANRAIKVK